MASFSNPWWALAYLIAFHGLEEGLFEFYTWRQWLLRRQSYQRRPNDLQNGLFLASGLITLLGLACVVPTFWANLIRAAVLSFVAVDGIFSHLIATLATLRWDIRRLSPGSITGTIYVVAAFSGIGYIYNGSPWFMAIAWTPAAIAMVILATVALVLNWVMAYHKKA